MLSMFVFPGPPAYLEAAAAQFDRPESARAAGRLVALTALANLCAQASQADPAHVAAILAKAAEFRDQIAIALRAAEAMLADVGAARGASPIPLGTKSSSLVEPLAAAASNTRAGSRKSSKEVFA